MDYLHERVTVANAQGNSAYTYVASFDNNMSETGRTDGAGRLTSSSLYSDPSDPYRPSLVMDGNACQSFPHQHVVPGAAAALAVTSNEGAYSGWHVVSPAGATVASDSSPNGWSVATGAGNANNTLTVSAPTNAAVGAGYKAYREYRAVVFDVVSASAGYGTTHYAWDQFGNLTSRTSPRGVTTAYAWNYSQFALGELTQVQEGAKAPTTFAYYDGDTPGTPADSGLLLSVTGPRPGTVGGRATVTSSFTYDALGNVLAATTPGNNAAASVTTTYNYTQDGAYSRPAAIGEPLTVTDALGKTSHLRYDARGNVVAALDALGDETDATYNLADQLLSVSLPATGQTGAGHASQAVSYLYPGGPALASAAYDEGGNQVRQVSSSYGLEGETLSVSGSTEPVSDAYDALYRLTALSDGNGHVTRYAYSPAGYLATVSYPGAGGATSGRDTANYTAYDADRNLLQRVDGNGVEADFVHSADPESRLTGIHYSYPAGYAGGTTGDVSFGYDAYGRTAAVTDSTGSRAYAYDDRDVTTSVTTTYTGLPAKTVSYSSWPNGSRQSMTTPAGTFSYSYDANGRLTGLTNPLGEAPGWQYQDNGWLWTQTLGNGATATYTYNALGQTTDLANRNSASALLSDFATPTAGGYDGAGNRTAVTASLPAAPTAYSGATSYSYDTKDQMTQEASYRAGGYTNAFGYDGAGNATTFRGVTRSFNADNQHTANTYDGDGNPTAYGGSACAFDPEDRATAFGTALTASYTGEGLRAWKQGSGGKTYFLYDGDKPVCELNGSGTVTATNTFGAAGLLSRHTSSGSAFYTFDLSGNAAQRLNSSGGVASSDTYDAFGSRVSTASGVDVFAFGGQWGYYTDAETGLALCTHRYYDPSNGQWLTRDPIGYAGGINLYGYVGSNPVNDVDASGLLSNTELRKLLRRAKECGWAIEGGGKHQIKLTQPGAPRSLPIADHDGENPRYFKQVMKQIESYCNGNRKPQPQPELQPCHETDMERGIRDDQPAQDITGETFLPIFIFPALGPVLGPIAGGVGRVIGPIVRRGFPIPVRRWPIFSPSF